jgi:hypothetical protein
LGGTPALVRMALHFERSPTETPALNAFPTMPSTHALYFATHLALPARQPFKGLPPGGFSELSSSATWASIFERMTAASPTVAPQFAFNLCLRKVKPEDLPGIDLTALRVLLNGAEPILADGIQAFEKRFAALGMRRGIVTPCYGLAEGTLAAAMGKPGNTLELRTSAPGSDPEARPLHASRSARPWMRSRSESEGPAANGRARAPSARSVSAVGRSAAAFSAPTGSALQPMRTAGSRRGTWGSSPGTSYT